MTEDTKLSKLTTSPGIPATATPTGRTLTVESGLAWLRTDAGVITLMLVSLGIYYAVPGLLSAAIGGVAFLALTVLRPNLSLAMVPLAAPLYYRPRLVGNLAFSLAEFIIIAGVAAWVLRDGYALLKSRKLPDIPYLVRQLGGPRWLLIAAILGLMGLLWLLVPAAEHRKVAIYDFWRTIVVPLIFFGLMLRWLRTPQDLWRMVAAWMVAAALVSREGVEQFLFGEATTMEGVQRATSVYPSATAFGIYLGRALALGIILAIFLPKEWRLWKIGLGVLSFVIGLGTLVSFARGAWIGVIVALVAVAVITRHKRLIQGIGAAVILGLAAVPFVRVERITSMFNFTARENTGLARTEIWTSALRILRDHPLTGIGQDQLLYQDAGYGVPQGRFITTSHPHNFVLDFWLRLGLPGLLWIVAVLAFFFWQSIQLWKRYAGTALGALTLALIASMVDFVVHGLLDMAYFTMDLALTFWMTVALILIIKRMSNAQSDEAART